MYALAFGLYYHSQLDRSWTDGCTEGMTSYRLPVPALLPELLTLPMELELREPAGEPIAETKV